MTAGRDALFDEGPSACPFVALDRDRERRADEPDPRHRCYATPAPEPRALAHQRAYCLTPTFTACPIFQDWAVRAAARPVPLRPVPAMPPPMSEDDMAAELAAAAAAAPTATPDYPEQVSLFDGRDQAADDEAEHIESEQDPATQPAPPPARRSAVPEFPGVQRVAPEVLEPSGPVIPPPSRSRPLPAPAAKAAAPPQRGKPTLRREDIVPSWERSRYDLPGGDRRSRSADWFSRLTLLLGVLAAASVLAVVILMLPLLLGGGAPGPTQRPSGVAGGTPTASPSPTAPATPEATWISYTIKLGDNLYKIATQFGITYEQLLAANPQIENPDFIRAGDVINIPTPDFVPPSPTRPASPSPSPS